MPMPVLFGSAAVSAGLVLLVWSLASARATSARTVSRNLSGSRRVTDLRKLQLEKSALQRAVRPALRGLAKRARRLTPAGRLEKLEERITLAGATDRWPLERVLAVKLILAAALGALGALVVWTFNLSGVAVFFVPLMAVAGFFLPEIILTIRADERQKAIQLALPDTLDQVTISVEAGLGFEAALERAARTTPGPLADELIRTLQEIRLGLSRKEAFRALAERTDVPSLRRFVFAVIQADDYGMPIANVLRVQADEMRTVRRQTAEERAQKVPIKMLFPLIFFIFPAMFIVLVGPAGIQLARLLFGADV